MELYLKFMGMLAFGLAGVGLVLKVLLETLFNEWDAFSDVYARSQAYLEGRRHVHLIRPEDILLEADKNDEWGSSPRLVDVRREQLKQLDEIEARLVRARLAPSN